MKVKWQPIKFFKPADHKQVLVWIETADAERNFAAIAVYKKRPGGVNWTVCGNEGGHREGEWHKSCVNWWAPIDIAPPDGHGDTRLKAPCPGADQR